MDCVHLNILQRIWFLEFSVTADGVINFMQVQMLFLLQIKVNPQAYGNRNCQLKSEVIGKVNDITRAKKS
jgi:hypothetical protein